MLWISIQFALLNKEMDSKTSGTKLKFHVEKLKKDTQSSFKPFGPFSDTHLIEKMAHLAL